MADGRWNLMGKQVDLWLGRVFGNVYISFIGFSLAAEYGKGPTIGPSIITTRLCLL